MVSLEELYVDIAIDYWHIFIPLILVFASVLYFASKKTHNGSSSNKSSSSPELKSNTNNKKSKQQKDQTKGKEKEKEKSQSSPPQQQQQENTNETVNNTISSPNSTTPQHPLLFLKMKGMSEPIECIRFSSNGKYLSLCGTERSIRMFLSDSIFSKPPQSFNLQLPFDNATALSWGNNVLYASLNDSKKLISFNIFDQKNSLGKSYELGFTVPLDQKNNVTCICSSPNAQYILTCGNQDSIAKIWTLKGQLVQSINTGQIKNFTAAMSNDGRFFAFASFTSEVKIYETFLKKDGSVDQSRRVMSLSGYKTCVYSLCFSPDSTKLLTSSKDGLIKYWNINVRYQDIVDPECIYSVSSDIGPLSSVALSPDCSVIAGINVDQSCLAFFNLSDGALIASVDIDSLGRINSMCWSPDSKYLVMGGNDKLLYFWSNPKSVPKK
ncbi:hypothetical protein CYY_006911 [Polysphondylium violaceum]|uniref:WD40 repeat-containing protein n=1 Tax=Polysphondylium violaceum TaxID=133409 RepID=A0A8J4PRQ6_9MYCE|nr:hypothetical protein CYY_006911 [Polysphondylium violaceum]